MQNQLALCQPFQLNFNMNRFVWVFSKHLPTNLSSQASRQCCEMELACSGLQEKNKALMLDGLRRWQACGILQSFGQIYFDSSSAV